MINFIIGGNWKMKKGIAESIQSAKKLVEIVKDHVKSKSCILDSEGLYGARDP